MHLRKSLRRMGAIPRLRDLGMNAYWLGHSFMWNSIHPILLPVMLLSYHDASKNTAYGLLTFAGLLIALVTQPLSGALSDQTRHALGRRRPWMGVGLLLASGCLLTMVLSRRLWLLAASYLMLQVASNLSHGAAQGLIPDLVPVRRRGMAAGLKHLFDTLGIVAAALVAGRVMSVAAPQPALMGGLIIATLLFTAGLTFAGAHEKSSATAPGRVATAPLCDAATQLLHLDLRGHSGYRRLLYSRFFVLLGSFTVQSFALFYFRDVLKFEAPARMVGNVMTVIGACVLLVVYPAGVLSQLWGRKRLATAASALAALGLGLLVLVPHGNPMALYLVGILVGIGLGAFSSVNWAWAIDLVPPLEAGKYLGLTNVATAGSAAVARLMGPLIDVLNGWMPNVGYTAVFGLAAAAALAGLFTTLRIPEGIPESAPPQDLGPT
ncbi:MAG: MFS transporter [Chloroflexota bacterium]